jgi:hypothetical protein
MKRVIIALVLTLSLSMVACTKNNTAKNEDNKKAEANAETKVEKKTKTVNGVEVTLTEKAQEISTVDYVDKFQNIFNELYKKYGDKVHNPDKDSLEYYEASKSQHKELVEQLSKYRTDDDSVNKSHDELIDLLLKRVKLNNDMIDLMNKESDDKDKKIEILKEMIESNNTKIEKAIKDLEDVLGVKFNLDDSLNEDSEKSSDQEKSSKKEESPKKADNTSKPSNKHTNEWYLNNGYYPDYEQGKWIYDPDLEGDIGDVDDSWWDGEEFPNQ